METPTNEKSSVMTLLEVAAYLRLYPRIVGRLAREGQFPAFKVGGRWRVKRELLDRWLEEKAMQNVGESLK